MSLPALAPPASLDPAQPTGSQNISEGDDWIRYLQNVLKTYFPGIAGIVNASHTELNYTVGATSAIQNQLDALVLSVTAALGNVPLWVSGSTYAAPAVVYSPITFFNYRKITASSVSSTDPSLDLTNWVCLSPSQGLVLLDVKTASASATIDFTSYITSAYEEYEIHFQNVVPASNQSLYLRTSSNGGSSFDATGTDYFYTGVYNASGTTTATGTGSETQAQLVISGAPVSITAAHGGISGKVIIANPAGTTTNKQIQFNTTAATTSTNHFQINGSGGRVSTSAVNAIRFLFASGNIASGSFKLYGLRKAL